MLAWLLTSLGISDQLTSRLEDVRWVWARPGWFYFGLLLLAPVGWAILRRHRLNLPHASPRARAALGACRIGVLALLVVVLGGPYLRLDESIDQKPVLAMIVDESGSMSLPAGPFEPDELRAVAALAGLVEPGANGDLPPLGQELGERVEGLTRSQLLEAALAKLERGEFRGLSERYELRRYRVARRVRRAEPGRDFEPVPPGELSESALGLAVDEAVHDAAGRPIAGVVLMSDGRWTIGPGLHAAARRTGGSRGEPGANAPVFTVPIGSPRTAPDVALLDVFAPPQVAQDDTVAVVATIASHGYDGQEVDVTLRQGRAVLDTRKVKLGPERRQQVRLTFKGDRAGAKVLTVSVAPRPDERVKDNNEQALSIRVESGKLKVLLVEGFPRWDFRFLDHALRQDEGLEVAFVMESQLVASGIKPEELPAVAQLPTDAAGFAKYHAVILGDVSPAMLPPAVQAALAQAVEEEGLGLIVQAGTQRMPQAFLDGPLGTLLPVRFAVRESPAPDAPGEPTGGIDAPAFKPFTMHVTPGGSMHPAFALYGDAARNRQVWSGMPPFYWAANAVEITPGATLLAEVETEAGRRPLIVEQFVGRGRVLMLGLDSTFRWRRNVGDVLFYRFWGQAIRHVARRDERSEGESWIEAAPRHVEPGSPIAVELYAVNPSGQPLNDASVSVDASDGRETRPLLMRRGPVPGHYRAAWTPDAPGPLTFGYTDRGGRVVSADVRVADSGRERLHPTVDRDALGALGDATGGRLLELSDLHKLPTLLKGRVTTVRRLHEEEVWDNWLVLLLLVTLYCTDIGIRRLSGMI